MHRHTAPWCPYAHGQPRAHDYGPNRHNQVRLTACACTRLSQLAACMLKHQKRTQLPRIYLHVPTFQVLCTNTPRRSP